MADLTSFDVVVLIIVALAALAGLARGFIGEIVSLLAWGAGIAAVRFLYTPGKVIAARLTGTEAGGAILALVVLFISAFLTVRILGGRLSESARRTAIGPVDRVLGLGFGAAKGVLAAALLFLLVNLTFDTIDPREPSPEWIARARTAPTLAMITKGLVDFVEQRRRLAPDSATADPGPAEADGPRDGYDRRERSALDRLLDKQEKASPSTPI